MRIAIVGDLQYEKGENIDSVARDIAQLNPDYTILLGDYGYWESFGCYEAFNDVAEAFEKANIKNVVPLIGNHDVQNEAGERLVKSGFVAENYKRAFGYYPENKILELEKFRVFCVNIEPQKKDDFYFEYECYVSDSSFEKICKELEDNSEKQVVMITHAPPVGCGLLTVPAVHVRAANAYLNQDHNPEKWAETSKTYRQIIMWFSGHYHMGHSYPDSCVVTDGLAYFTTGSPTSGTRDGMKHTRIIDEQNGELVVRTYDHNANKINEKPDFIWKLSDERASPSEEPLTGVFGAGSGNVVKNGLKTGGNGRVYAMTDNGFLWEIDLKTKSTMGTIHYSDKYKLDDFYVDDEYVWRLCGDKAFGHKYSNTNRFMREKDWKHCIFIEKDRREIAYKPQISLNCNNRIACEIDSSFICTTFNDKSGKLFFEILEKNALIENSSN